jgi:HEAT repeat protein
VQEIDKLKSDIFSDDWDKVRASANRLFEIGGQENIDYLLGLLDQTNTELRNAIAITFRDNKFSDALEPILNAINKKENKGRTGTLVYALEKLDCRFKLKELFHILFDNNSYEVQNHILTILDEQTFDFTEADLLEIKSKWEKLKDNWNEFNNVDKDNLKGHDIDRDLVQSFVDGYVTYLEQR